MHAAAVLRDVVGRVESGGGAELLRYALRRDGLLDELGFEAEDLSFADELKLMAVFSTDGEDEERLK
eukprot:4148236-Prymnesium_polylepis.1